MRKKILTCFFILILTSQVYGLALGHKADLNEKRLLAKAPEYKAGRLLTDKYYKKIAKFLDDRYPFRRSFIISKNWIDYYIFSTSPSPKVHMGREGWFFMKEGMNDYFKQDCEKKKKARELARKLSAIEKTLQSAGKKFLFIVPPDKATIYPEHIRVSRTSGNCGKNFYDFFIEALADYPIQGFIRLDRILLDEKKDRQVYYKKGSHWNHRTSVLVSRLILERLSTPSRKFSLPDIKFKERKVTRDLASLFSLNLMEKSDYTLMDQTKSRSHTKTLKPLPNGMPHLRMRTDAEAGVPLLPRAIIYRDSFLIEPLRLIQGSFTGIEALWSRNIPMNKNTIDFPALRSSKIVILEVVERNLDKIIIRKNTLLKALRYKPDNKHKG